MLILSRRPNEVIRIGDGITVTVVAAEGSRVRLAIGAPPEVKVLRKELAGKRPRQAASRILIVDDCPEDRETFRRLMTDRARPRFVFAEADSGEDGLLRCRAEPPDCVLLDYRLPDLDGIEFLDRLRRQRDRLLIPVVLVTGRAADGLADRALRSGAQQFLAKTDLSGDVLRRAIRAAMRQAHVTPRLN